MPLRIGILNIMPMAETYEPLLLGPLSRVTREVKPVFIRLETHSYGSSDPAHLARHYRSLEDVLATGRLDGLILTGAPVELLPFEEIRYWPELSEILCYARSHVRSTLGLCWGGLALAHLIGVPKRTLDQKVFGVFDNRRLEARTPLLRGQPKVFHCAHSRHAGIADIELEHAAADGRVRLLSHAPETGYSIFETPDHAFVGHLGHPEYVAERLVFEAKRDRDLGRADVPPPANFDADAPVTSWHAHREAFFERWVELVAESPCRDRPRRSGRCERRANPR